MGQIQRIIRNVPQHWVGDGFPVRSLFSYNEGNQFDPFLLLDYAGPHKFEPSEAKRGVGEHPHRGFETVTIVYQGELEHRDSSGSLGKIGAGDVQWMTAASGVVHEEFHSQRFTREGGTLEKVQLWVNLPARAKLSLPGYQSLLDADIPRVELANSAGIVRVIAGDFQGVRGAAGTFTPINIWDIQLSGTEDIELRLPDGHTKLILIQSGSVQVSDTPTEGIHVVQIASAAISIDLKPKTASRMLVLTGEPLNEPVFGQGPFVMNTREEIMQAIRDYQQGLMGRLD
jgi:quercetin 2,3-dioxygenase